MTKDKVKKLLDYIPLVILSISLAYLLYFRVTEEILITWRHWVAILLLPVNYYLFRLNHQLGILVLGLILLIGLFGITQYSPGVSISYLYWTPLGAKIPLFYGQPIFLLWIVIHYVISGRYYFGIATKEYWQNLLSVLRKNR